MVKPSAVKPMEDRFVMKKTFLAYVISAVINPVDIH